MRKTSEKDKQGERKDGTVKYLDCSFEGVSIQAAVEGACVYCGVSHYAAMCGLSEIPTQNVPTHFKKSINQPQTPSPHPLNMHAMQAHTLCALLTQFSQLLLLNSLSGFCGLHNMSLFLAS